MASAVTPGRPVRPATVTYAVYLLYLLAALQVVGTIAGLATLGPTREATREALGDNPNVDTILGVTTFFTVFSIAIGLLFAVAWVVLAVFDGRGSNPARIVTWVLGGIFLCCSASLLVGTVAGNAFSGMGGPGGGGIDQAELQRRIDEALPGWYQPASLILGVLQVLAILAVIVLLALRPSAEFFRRPAPTWEPPVPGYPPPPPPPA